MLDGVDGDGLVASPRCSGDGVKVHAPSQAQIRISGTYASILPDAQVAQVRWDDGLVQIDYHDGSAPGFCDTIFSANALTLADEEYVDWNLYDLSSASNDVGHGDTQDALGLQPCTARIYTMFLKNKAESTGDLLVGSSPRDQREDLDLTGCQPGRPRGPLRSLLASGSEHCVDRVWREATGSDVAAELAGRVRRRTRRAIRAGLGHRLERTGGSEDPA